MLLSDWDVDSSTGCWLWTGRVERGYPVVWNPRPGVRKEWAHRSVWAAHHGPIAPGMQLDHLCRRTRCVRPSHMQVVTQDENKRRMRWRNRANPEWCSRGHSFRGFCARTPEGGYVCRACDGRTRPS